MVDGPWAMVNGQWSLQERLARHAQEWNVSVEETRETETSLIAFGKFGTRNVVLKVVRVIDSEEWRSGEILASFRGHGMIAPLAFCDGAVLLPRLIPGWDLATICLAGRDDEATEVLATLIQDMSTDSPGMSALPCVERLGVEYGRYRHNAADFVSAEHVDRAESFFTTLCASSQHRRLLHGDLHHYNVLFDNVTGWTAIDPWGVIGEVEFEIGAALRNPIGVPELLASPKTIERRLGTYARRLRLDADRALRWAYATTVLAILWPVNERGIDVRGPFAKAVRSMLELLGPAS